MLFLLLSGLFSFFCRKHSLEFVAVLEVVKALFCKLFWDRLVITDYLIRESNPNVCTLLVKEFMSKRYLIYRFSQA